MTGYGLYSNSRDSCHEKVSRGGRNNPRQRFLTPLADWRHVVARSCECFPGVRGYFGFSGMFEILIDTGH